MSNPLSLQDIIVRLNDYWAARGCTIWQPHSEKVGAGTMNPATVLRVLGPEPWNVGYVEPSFRADDGRYAENPNRMQMHTQYQVILKPDPGNSQELYLGSLEAIGLKRIRHDIRFVEDNWESPVLGAWGLGWEVWLDGQEITQFTYFQQAGGQMLDPVSVEITYGLERIAMYLQHRADVWSIDYDGVHTYGEIYRTQEIEHCIYNFELADVERQKQLYELYKAEAEACIEQGLVAPAHDYVLRQSHAFNILDARGAVGVTERAKFFADMRVQARAIAELYAAQRMREEYPWLEESQGNESRTVTVETAPVSNLQPPISEPQDFVLELGSEELPAADVVAGIQQLQEKLPALLNGARLSYTGLQVTGTPRRLVAYVTGLTSRQADEVVERRGPPVDRAFDADGNPTRAADGFARGQGVPVADLEVRDNYVYAVKRVAGRPTLEVLPGLLVGLLDGLRWDKAMRWNHTNASYPRPLRWTVALYGAQVVPFTWAGVTSGRTSRGPRFADAAADLPPGRFTTFQVTDSRSYFDAVAAQGVILDREERRHQIAEQVAARAAEVGGVTPDDPKLLDEVTDLVEAPVAVPGSFERKYLELPEPVLIAVMKKHQRYFPVVRGEGRGARGELLPYFITIANSDHLAHPDVVRDGNEGVIRARYADAAFFYGRDTARPLAEFTPWLATLTFHEQLGSMLDKVERLRKLAPQIARMVGVSSDELAAVERASALCKSDLVTEMVVEMTDLQGVVGEIYALRSGESPAVARAIREHYLPRYAGDAAPETAPGLALGLADRLDSLAGLFGVGATPSGSADPFGLRRAALGAVNNLLAAQVDFPMRDALARAAALHSVPVGPEALAEAGDFVMRRLQGVLLEMGYPFDVVEAVLAVRGDNPWAARRACDALGQTVAEPWWNDAFVAYARCARIVRNIQETLPLNPAAYQKEEERALHAAHEQAAQAMEAADEPARVLGQVLRTLQDPINRYFDAVLVNAEEESLQAARQALVQRIARLPARVADLSRLQGF